MKKTILIFGSLAAIITLLFELVKLSVKSQADLVDLYVVISGLAFVGLGLFLGKFFHHKPNKSAPPKPNTSLTNQELRVLILMNDGLSNQEIAGKLFIAESTVKTHVSNILSKLAAKRRTEAIKIGRDLELIA